MFIFFFNKLVKYITKGVLPDPPAFILPTQITGIPTFFLFFLITLEIIKYKKLRGNKKIIIIFSNILLFFFQKFG